MHPAFEAELATINGELVQMTRLVGSAMNRATQALLDSDLALAESVIAGDDAIDAIVDQLATGTLAGYWPAGREHVDNEYADLDFPFPRIDPPPLAMTQDWTLDRLLTYLRSWSSVSRYRDQHGVDPVSPVAEELASRWGDPSAARPVHWPLTVLAGRT